MTAKEMTLPLTQPQAVKRLQVRCHQCSAVGCLYFVLLLDVGVLREVELEEDLLSCGTLTSLWILKEGR